MQIPYKCTGCGVENRKLWRQYSTFADHIKLMCAACACVDQGKENNIDDLGKRTTSEGDKTDQIGWLVPAVPCHDGESFWGYTSVPQEDVMWWRGLPT